MRILVVQTGFLGDAVLTTPLVRALDAEASHVVVVTTRTGLEVFRGLAQNCLQL